MEQIFGIIERVVFNNTETGFTVVRLKEGRKTQLTTLVGKLSGVQVGESVRCSGSWKQNAAHGMQFCVESYSSEAPSDLEGIEKYLASGLIRGIGPKYAKRIIHLFGTDTLKMLDENPSALKNVPGIGKKRVETITTCWQEQRSIREVMIFLQKIEISPAYAQKIYKIYGEETISRVQENPFFLAKHIPGIGFKRADAIAQKMGFSNESELRIESGILYALSELASEGHTCYPLEEFMEKGTEILGVSPSLIEKQIAHLVQEEQIIHKDNLLWLKPLYICENGIARELNRLQRGHVALRAIDLQKAIDWVEKTLHIALAEGQKEAVQRAVSKKVHIITGGPGTGKSTITKAILAITEKLSRHIILAAPTGRAAKRLSAITKRPASTIHSLLQYDFKKGGWRKNKESPLVCDLIVIDEASMIDTALMFHLLRAIPNHARVIFVGDIHQLPSVGPGNVLKELIESETLSVSTLTEIFRQAKGSAIITNAHRINQGEFPYLKPQNKSDFFFLEAEEPSGVLAQILELVSERLPKRYPFDRIDDIQVLCPMKRGVIGTENLNLALANALNPKNEPLFSGGARFAEQDKVMQIRNNYQKEVFNGDIGRIWEIDRPNQKIYVKFDQKGVEYAFNELDELTLAYATSIHKYQGSEAPCVVIPVHTAHFVMLQRNLLYTGVTRGKKLVVLVGSEKAIAMAVQNDAVKKRHTHLTQFLISTAKELANLL